MGLMTLNVLAAITLLVALAPGQPKTAQRVADLRRPTSTLVWRGGKVDIEGAVSPDGRFISFVDRATGGLSLHDVVTGTDRPIVKTNNSQSGQWRIFAEASTISRDGTKVAYSWYDKSIDRYELWVANL
jgi:hypothetical protein